MRNYLINIVKTSKLVYLIYYYVGSLLIKILGLFCRIDDKSILFVAFGGKKYDDSPKVIFENMKKLEHFSDYQFYWAFVDPDKYEVDGAIKLKIDTLKYFVISQKAKIWITNSAIERGMNYKKKKTLYINTWHGTPLKKIGKDEHGVIANSGFGSKNIHTQDYMLAQSSYDAKIFSHIFDLEVSKIIIADLPRNDELVKDNNELRYKIRKKLNILDKKVILYAPTYREFQRNDKHACILKPPVDFKKWENNLGDEYVILVRAHYEVVDILGIESNNFIKNVSNYNNLNELMIASDMLISDYSSVFVDYSILSKPMFCFAYDFDEYTKKRGIYIDLKKEFPGEIHFIEDDLLQDILTFDKEKLLYEIKNFKNKYAPVAGSATEKVIKLVKEIENEENNYVWDI